MKLPLTGACHCGAVAFQVDVRPTEACSCNCSFCRRRGWRHAYVAVEAFHLGTGEEALRAYRFGSFTDHFFCRVCGIHTHAYCTYTDPPHIYYNLACCEGLDVESLPAREVDGRRI